MKASKRPRKEIVAILGALSLIAAPAVAQVVTEQPPVPSDVTRGQVGAVAVPAFTLPPSVLSSEEQKRAYAHSMSLPGGGAISVPKDPKIIAGIRAYINQQFAPAVAFVEQRYPTEIAHEVIAGVEVIRVRPKGGVTRANRRRVLLNLHGGAFMVGWPSVALLDAIPLASLSGIEVITINYRMYPEATHPAALEDLTAVYREILKRHKPRDIGLFGGSAGGVVTLQAIPWFKDRGLPGPGAIGALACGFQTAVGDSAIWNYNGGFSLPGTVLVERAGYFGERSRTDWVPGTAPDLLSHYPPTLWLSGTRAPELSGAATGNARMLEAGVDSQVYVIEGGWHSSYSTAPQTPESQAAMRHVAQWFGNQLGR